MAGESEAPIPGQTPWQTVGPFFHYSLPWFGGADLTGGGEIGARPELIVPGHVVLGRPGPRAPPQGRVIEIDGRVLDGAGEPVADALIEIWQADSAGRYDGRSDFIGFGRAATSVEGEYRFRTIFPGRTKGPGGSLQAPHIAVGVLGRGLIKRLVTRIYFEDGDGAAEDPILALVPPGRRTTLMARRRNIDPAVYRFDIVLQGEHETVFFDC